MSISPASGGASGATISGITNSIAVHILSTGGTIQIKTDPSSVLSGITSSVGVFFDRGNQTVTANAGIGTFNVQFDPGHTLGIIKGITETVAIFFDRGDPGVKLTSGTVTDITNTIKISASDGTFAVYFSPSTPTIKKEKASTGTFNKVAIVTTARQVVAANANRLSLSLVHDSANTMYIGLTNTVGSVYTGTGFPLLANQIFVMDDYTGAVFAVHEAGESNIKYIEI